MRAPRGSDVTTGSTIVHVDRDVSLVVVDRASTRSVVRGGASADPADRCTSGSRQRRRTRAQPQSSRARCITNASGPAVTGAEYRHRSAVNASRLYRHRSCNISSAVRHSFRHVLDIGAPSTTGPRGVVTSGRRRYRPTGAGTLVAVLLAAGGGTRFAGRRRTSCSRRSAGGRSSHHALDHAVAARDRPGRRRHRARSTLDLPAGVTEPSHNPRWADGQARLARTSALAAAADRSAPTRWWSGSAISRSSRRGVAAGRGGAARVARSSSPPTMGGAVRTRSGCTARCGRCSRPPATRAHARSSATSPQLRPRGTVPWIRSRHRHVGGFAAMDKLLNDFTVNRPIDADLGGAHRRRAHRAVPAGSAARGDRGRHLPRRRQGQARRDLHGVQGPGEVRRARRRRTTGPCSTARAATPPARATPTRMITATLRVDVDTETTVHRRDRPADHRQGRPVRPRDHGRRQQEADGPVRARTSTRCSTSGGDDAAASRRRPAATPAPADGRRGRRRRQPSPRTTPRCDAPRPVTTAEPARPAPRRRRSRTVRKIDGPANEPIELSGLAGGAILKRAAAARRRARRCCSSSLRRLAPSLTADRPRPTGTATRPMTIAPTTTAVRELLGRAPQGALRGGRPRRRRRPGRRCATRPLLDDGTPMPTRYWLVGPRRGGRASAGSSRPAACAQAEADDRSRRWSPTRIVATPPSATRRSRPTTPGPRPSRRRRRHPHGRQVPPRALRLVPRRRRRSGRRVGGGAARRSADGAGWLTMSALRSSRSAATRRRSRSVRRVGRSSRRVGVAIARRRRHPRRSAAARGADERDRRGGRPPRRRGPRAARRRRRRRCTSPGRGRARDRRRRGRRRRRRCRSTLAARRGRGRVPHARHRVRTRQRAHNPGLAAAMVAHRRRRLLRRGRDHAPAAARRESTVRARERRADAAFGHPSMPSLSGLRLYGQRVMMRPLVAGDFAGVERGAGAQRALAGAVGADADAARSPTRPGRRDAFSSRCAARDRERQAGTAFGFGVFVDNAFAGEINLNNIVRGALQSGTRRLLDRPGARRPQLHRRGGRGRCAGSRSRSSTCTGSRSASCRATPTAGG